MSDSGSATMPSRKRSLDTSEEASADGSLLNRIRGMWQFANLCQWIYTFGKAAKIDESIDIDDLETACLNPDSTMLLDIGLALLKLVSSHRGLTLDIFDSQARKQYLDKAPDLNPFGTDEEPKKFQEFDSISKIKVLQQLTQWTMIYPERIREKMDEQKDIDQASWRIEPYGWDSEDRTYFVLDDNRVYRLTEAPPAPPPKPKKKKTPYRAGRRSSKRRRTVVDEEDAAQASDHDESTTEPQDDGLGGMTWECIAVTLDEVRQLLESFRRTRDGNEKILRQQLEEYLLPILEKQEESRKRKALQRERELLNLAKMANAKRSSRIASKVEQQKLEEKVREEEEQIRATEEAARREAQREEQARLKREKERDFRMASREERLREREARRLRHQEELAQLSDDNRSMDHSAGRISERRLQSEIERNRQALQELEDEDEDWIFDCTCGLYGQVDDGAHSVACENCNVWQHSKCLGISEEEADQPNFHFICDACRRRKEEAKNRPRTTIKLKVNGPSSSPTSARPVAEQDPSARTGANSSMVVEMASKLPEPSAQATSNSPTKPVPRLEEAPSAHPLPPLGRPSILPPPSLRDSSQTLANASPQPGSPSKPTKIEAPRQIEPDVSESRSATATLHANIHTSMTDVEDGRRNAGLESAASLSQTPSGAPDQGPAQSPALDSALSTPAINRDIYRAAHYENGNIPAQGGLSPIKHSPPGSFTSASGGSLSNTPAKIPPGVTLSPSPREPILTPPTKHSEPIRSQGHQ